MVQSGVGVLPWGAPTSGCPGQGPIPSSVLEHRRVPPGWSSGRAGVRGPIPCAGVPAAPPWGGGSRLGGGRRGSWGRGWWLWGTEGVTHNPRGCAGHAGALCPPPAAAAAAPRQLPPSPTGWCSCPRPPTASRRPTAPHGPWPLLPHAPVVPCAPRRGGGGVSWGRLSRKQGASRTRPSVFGVQTVPK